MVLTYCPYRAFYRMLRIHGVIPRAMIQQAFSLYTHVTLKGLDSIAQGNALGEMQKAGNAL
ncbi:MAG: hypothetical protein LBL79_13395 [Prevotella sp.]|nr:hypothetical protein [Prevotella sp.]